MNEPGTWQEITALLRDSLSSAQDIYGSIMQLSEQLAANHSVLSENLNTVLQILEYGCRPAPSSNCTHIGDPPQPNHCPYTMNSCNFCGSKRHEPTVLYWSSLPFWQG